MKDLESIDLSYAIVGEYLADLKEGFGGRDNETMKVAELKKSRIGRKDDGEVCTGVQGYGKK